MRVSPISNRLDANTVERKILELDFFSRSLRRTDCLGEAFEIISESTKVLGVSRASVCYNIDADSPMIGTNGENYSETIFGWPKSLLNWWFDEKVWRIYSDAHECRSHSLPFASQVFDLPDNGVRNSLTDLRIHDAIAVPVHTAERSSFVGWTFEQAGNSAVVLEQLWTPLMALSYAFIDALDRCEGKHKVVAPSLTKRQRECVEWIGNGKTVAEVAIILGLSPHTVEEYVRTAAQRLGVCSRAQLIVQACRLGII